MSNNEMTRSEYHREVKAIAESLIDEAKADGDARQALEERLWETIGGHEWIIYTAYNYDVLRHSDNDGYSIEEFGAETAIKDGVLNTAGLAFGALYADVSEELWDIVSDCDECGGEGCEDCGERGWIVS